MAALDGAIENLNKGNLGMVTTNVTFEQAGLIRLVIALSVLAIIVTLTIVLSRKI